MKDSTLTSTITSCTILWSTQSGRAKACSRRVARILGERTEVKVAVGGAIDDYSLLEKLPTKPNTHLWIFLISTTGDGEQCDSIRQTWKALLSKSLPKTLMAHFKFVLYCLGDRAYGPQFCAAGRKFAARCVQLGATPLTAVGYGDDGTPNGGVFADLDLWIDKMLLPVLPRRKESIDLTLSVEPWYTVVVTTANPSNNNVQARSKEWTDPSYQIDYDRFVTTSCPLQAYSYDTVSRDDDDDKLPPLVGQVVSNDRITADSWEQNTRHICIDARGRRLVDGLLSELPYQAGDVATVMPSNSNENVEKLLNVLPESIQSLADSQLTLETRNDTRAATDSISWPKSCTLRGLLTYCADIQGLPEREDFRLLSAYCDLHHTMGKDQRDKLLSLSDTSGAALYADYVLREKRCWADVLYDFDSIQLSIESLLSILPAMRPRHFSIASAPSQRVETTKDDTFQIELCVAVVEGTTPLGRSYQGLCSNYLANLGNGEPIQLWIQPGSFGKLPLELNTSGRFETPTLCIGSGTGIAPLRSLIMEREAVRNKDVAGTHAVQGTYDDDDTCDNLLIFGCRKESMDYYYRNVWDTLVSQHRLFVWTAFSRDQWHKIYVQQVLRGALDGKLVQEHIMERNGAIYVAGGAKMARAVKEEILECLAKAAGGEKQAAVLLKRMHLQGRYSVEAWS